MESGPHFSFFWGLNLEQVLGRADRILLLFLFSSFSFFFPFFTFLLFHILSPISPSFFFPFFFAFFFFFAFSAAAALPPYLAFPYLTSPYLSSPLLNTKIKEHRDFQQISALRSSCPPKTTLPRAKASPQLILLHRAPNAFDVSQTKRTDTVTPASAFWVCGQIDVVSVSRLATGSGSPNGPKYHLQIVGDVCGIRDILRFWW